MQLMRKTYGVVDGGPMVAAGNISTDMPQLLKRLYRFRERAAQRGLFRATRHWRKAALVAKLRRDWAGGYVLTSAKELAFIPAPLDARGEHVLFYGFDVPEPALRFAPSGAAVIDIGANLGEWAVPLAMAVGSAGRVLCCEPNPTAAAALSATLLINDLCHAQVMPVAVSSADGEGHLVIDVVDSGRSHLADDGVAVPLRSLDSIVAEHGLDRLDLLKIDAEGHEAQVFAGAGETLRRLRPTLIFETGHEAGAQRTQIADWLDAVDYDIVAVLHHYGALPCTMADYRATTGACAGTEARNILALPRRPGAD
jgi:FkbM family methyltransferase